jgi:WKF domain-containing protein
MVLVDVQLPKEDFKTFLKYIKKLKGSARERLIEYDRISMPTLTPVTLSPTSVTNSCATIDTR